MGKDPALLWYPNDWIGGTMGMTFEQKGAYMELLMAQFNRGHMTSHMIGQIVGQHWDAVKDKFIQDENGLWYNNRLEIEQNKRKAYVNSRANNKQGTNQYSKKEDGNRSYDHEVTCHMENVNRDENKDKRIIRKAFIKPTIEEIRDYCLSRNNGIDSEQFFDYYEARGWELSGGKKMKDWQAAIRTWEKNGYSKPKKESSSALDNILTRVSQGG